MVSAPRAQRARAEAAERGDRGGRGERGLGYQERLTDSREAIYLACGASHVDIHKFSLLAWNFFVHDSR